jgi:hypothetical protein
MFYSVSTLLMAEQANESADSIWQECIFGVEAGSPKEARDIASQLARQREVVYQTAMGVLAWKFKAVQSVFEIESTQLTHGVEVFSRFLKGAEAVSLLAPFEDSV